MLVRRTFARLFSSAFLLGAFALVLVPTVALAQGTGAAEGLQAVGEAGGITGGADLYTIIGRIINVVLGLLGTVLLVIMLYSGYEWMTSGGDAGKVDSAKTRIRNAIIGLIIIMTSFAITNFILSALISATGAGGGAGGIGPGGPGGFGFPGASGSLGGGIIETHVPPRDATGIPRNTAIVITFKEPINIASFIRDYDDNGTPDNLTDDATSSTTTGINNDNIKVYRSGQRDAALTTAQARVRFTPDRQTFVIKPVEYLGSATENTTYTVELTNDVQRADGTDAFSGAFASGYRWQFEVSTIVDLTAPRITSVIPRVGGRFAPNIVVQINFDEGIDPTTASGEWNGTGGFTNIQTRATPTAGGATTRPSGEFRISNQYRTVEFVTDLACGTNSCGRTVYCLPSDSSIAVEVLSPSMSDTPPQAVFTALGYDGVADMAGNGLDGNGDGDAQGSESDSIAGDDRYGWTFGTNSAPNLTPPTLRSTSPAAGDLAASSNIPLDQEPEALFGGSDMSGLLQGSTVNTETVVMRTNEPASFADSFWWSVSQEFLTSAGTPAGVGDEPMNSNISVGHRLYIPATSTTAVPVYQSLIKSGVQNIFQNCFNPAGSEACRADSTNPNCCDGTSQSGACAAPRPMTP